jgi:hypothetical protein
LCERSGDHDLEAPFLGTHAWIRSLNFSIVDDWRAWHLNGQAAGLSLTFSFFSYFGDRKKNFNYDIQNVCWGFLLFSDTGCIIFSVSDLP